MKKLNNVLGVFYEVALLPFGISRVYYVSTSKTSYKTLRIRTYKIVDGKKNYSGWVLYKNTVKTK